MFSVTPASGTVGPNDKPLPVQIGVTLKKELTIKDEPILHCQVIEPRRTSVSVDNSPSVSRQSTASTGEAIANIPIRVSCQSSFSRHHFFLACFISN